MTYFTVHLPTKGYLCQYLHTLYAKENQIIIDPATDFGDMIITKLASTLHSHMKPAELDGRLYRLTSEVKMKLPWQYFNKLPHKELTRHQIVRINRSLENKFEQDLCDIVSRAHDIMGIDRQTAIECFAQNHGIILEKHITYDALKQMEYRFRRKNAAHTVRKKIIQDLSCKIRVA